MVLSGRVEEEKMHLFVAETGSVESRCEGVVAELELIPNLVVNSAGLGAQALAKRFHGLGHSFLRLTMLVDATLRCPVLSLLLSINLCILYLRKEVLVFMSLLI